MRNRRDLLKSCNSNYGQNTLPINLYDDKYRMRERCTVFMRSELKLNPHENTACVFLTWTSLQMEMVVTLKNISMDRQGGFYPPPSRRLPHANHNLFRLRGFMIIKRSMA